MNWCGPKVIAKGGKTKFEKAQYYSKIPRSILRCRGDREEENKHFEMNF